MLRKRTLKLLAVEASMLVLAFTLKGIAAEQSRPAVTIPERVIYTDNQTAHVPEKTEPEIITEAYEPTQTLIGSRDWGAEDDEILLKVAMAEAEGESTEGKALVILVVLNRVWSDDFPDSIEDVVFQESQFSVTLDGGRYYTTTPNEDCYEALELVKHGWDESQGALFFESCDGGSWHSENLEFLYQVGNHRFYK